MNYSHKLAPIETNYVPRSMSLRAQDFSRHGYTAGCPSCAQIVTGIGTRKPHSPECRARMEALIAQEEEEGNKRVQAQNERKDQWIADRVQANAEGTHALLVPMAEAWDPSSPLSPRRWSCISAKSSYVHKAESCSLEIQNSCQENVPNQRPPVHHLRLPVTGSEKVIDRA